MTAGRTWRLISVVALTLGAPLDASAHVPPAPDRVSPACEDPGSCDPYAAVTPPLTPRPDSVVCVAGRGPRLQAVVAYPQQLPPPAVAVDDELRLAVRLMGEAVRQRSLSLGSVEIRLRVECDQRGGVTVLRLPVPPDVAATVSPDTLAPLLRQHPQAAPDEKYLVYYTAPPPVPAWMGQAQGGADDQPGPANINNRAGTVAVQYRPWPLTAYSRPHWRILLHEYLHSLGAVQESAPHSDGDSHQTQVHDVMGGKSDALAAAQCATFTVDCGADDYFHPTPPPGSYLAENWNVAGPANRWIERRAQGT